MTPPVFEYGLSNENPVEAKTNFDILNKKFPQLVLEGEKRLIPNLQHGNELTVFCNDSSEELYIYPGSGEWYLRKEQRVGERLFSFLNSMYLIPEGDEEGKLKIIVPDYMGSYYHQSSNNVEIPLVRDLYSSNSNYYYGVINQCLCGERGCYYKNIEEYEGHRKMFEERTALRINSFFLILSSVDYPPETGKSLEGRLLLGMELLG
jgi:hypothetical protein